MEKIRPVILCGGAGSRLWPMSRATRPKQFHSLYGKSSLLSQTAGRFVQPDNTDADNAFSQPLILCSADLGSVLASECLAGQIDPSAVLLEPEMRDTAPAIAAATAFLFRENPSQLMFVVPSDAMILDKKRFRDSAIRAGRVAQDQDIIMTIGVVPDRPETQYGYIERHEPMADGWSVKQFREKPDRVTANHYYESGDFFWNAGMFMARAEYMAKEFERLQPEIWHHACEAVEKAEIDGNNLLLNRAEFSACEKVSMDYAIMERTHSIGVVPAEFAWDDLGSWSQLHAHALKDDQGNAIKGGSVTVASHNNFVRSVDATVALAGVNDLAVVAEDGAVLVVPLSQGHLVKSAKEEMEKLKASQPVFGDRDAVRDWLVSNALPYWAKNGLDHQHGGVHEALTFSGQPASHDVKRLRVLARQIYVYSHAMKLGWYEDASGVLDHCFNHLVKTGWHPDGGWIHLYNRDGTVRDDTRDTYDQCFVLLACAWMMQAGYRPSEARDWADRTIGFMDAELSDPEYGGFHEGLAAKPELRRTNPHMHYLEAMLALYEATGEETYLDRADTIIALFENSFFDGSTSMLREHFNGNWKTHAGQDPVLRRVEPGHHYEWVSLLMRYHGFREKQGLKEKALSLYASASAFGHHAETGAAADYMQPDGSQVSENARCWPQTERLKAAIAMERQGVARASADRKSAVSVLFRHYLDGPVCGGWYDRINSSGRVTAPDMPSSTFYHVFNALADHVITGDAEQAGVSSLLAIRSDTDKRPD